MAASLSSYLFAEKIKKLLQFYEWKQKKNVFLLEGILLCYHLS